MEIFVQKKNHLSRTSLNSIKRLFGICIRRESIYHHLIYPKQTNVLSNERIRKDAIKGIFN